MSAKPEQKTAQETAAELLNELKSLTAKEDFDSFLSVLNIVAKAAEELKYAELGEINVPKKVEVDRYNIPIGAGESNEHNPMEHGERYQIVYVVETDDNKIPVEADPTEYIHITTGKEQSHNPAIFGLAFDIKPGESKQAKLLIKADEDNIQLVDVICRGAVFGINIETNRAFDLYVYVYARDDCPELWLKVAPVPKQK
jgi:hypothetical protein